MYILRQVPADPARDARGLSLDEAFVRMMALSERQYRFVRTCRVMHLLMTNVEPSWPDFLSHATNDAVARQEIKRQVCRHGLGEFEVLTDTEYAQLASGAGRAA